MIINHPQFYARDTIEVARDLIGKILVHTYNNRSLSGIIVETEAYRGFDDAASHAYRGKTVRNMPMFGDVGQAYVYFIYGCHYCFNIVARDKKQDAGAVLIRALEPLDGIDCMLKNRNNCDRKILTNGPGKLTQALGISQEQNRCNLLASKNLYLIDVGHDIKSNSIKVSTRIGIRVAADLPWRFYHSSSPWVSR